ncbi:hypothetical protein ABZW30_18815 [Kitasatospora sp. NPDC004669]
MKITTTGLPQPQPLPFSGYENTSHPPDSYVSPPYDAQFGI